MIHQFRNLATSCRGLLCALIGPTQRPHRTHTRPIGELKFREENTCPYTPNTYFRVYIDVQYIAIYNNVQLTCQHFRHFQNKHVYFCSKCRNLTLEMCLGTVPTIPKKNIYWKNRKSENIGFIWWG